MPRIALFVAVCLIAANMRATITGVGPLLEQIADDLGTTTVALGALASIPLLTWALVSPLTHALSERFGTSRTLLLSLVVLGIGTIWRSLPGSDANLWLGTALIGAALAVANVLMPAIVRRDFADRVPQVMGVYTALLAGVGAVASGVVVPISLAAPAGPPLGWRTALAATGILVPLAVVAWLIAMRRLPRELRGRRRGSRTSTGIWRDAAAWQVAGYMGLQSASFYILLTWLAPYATSHGHAAVSAGVDVMVYQIFAIAGSIALPAVLRGGIRRWIPALIPVLGIVGVIGMLTAPDLLTLWALPTGLSAGASLGMSLTLMAERARDHRSATALSGMAQSVGYLLAAIGPVAFGGLHGLDGGWLLPFILLTVIVVAQLAVGIAVGRERFVLDGH